MPEPGIFQSVGFIPSGIGAFWVRPARSLYRSAEITNTAPGKMNARDSRHLLLHRTIGNYETCPVFAPRPCPYIHTNGMHSSMQRSKLKFLIPALLSLFLCAPAFAAPKPLPITVSIAPQKYIMERIGGSAVAVSVLLKPGSDPHSYEPGPSQMRGISRAAAWFTIGVPFEDAWLPRIKGAAPNLRVISSIQGIRRLPFGEPVRTLADLHQELIELGKYQHREQRHDFHPREGAEVFEKRNAGSGHGHDGYSHSQEGHGHSHDGDDPHVWLSPTAVRAMLPSLARELGDLMPDRGEFFRANARAFDAELDALDRELEARFNSVPPLKKVFLTFHPSWRYFAHTYQLVELAIETDGKEPGPRSLKAITDLAKSLGITTIFVEPQFSRAAAAAVAQAIGASVVEADPLEENLMDLYRNMARKLLTSFNHE